jgi:dTDP-4-dehydrorhamnose 3,5-epimerase-like enzyme
MGVSLLFRFLDLKLSKKPSRNKVKIKKIAISTSDQRGSITDIINHLSFNGATMIESKKGSIRGNHYHKHTIQFVYILNGKMRCAAKKVNEPLVEAIVEPGDLISHEAYEAHNFEAIEDTLFLVLSSGLRTGDDYEKDTFRLNIPISKFSENEI